MASQKNLRLRKEVSRLMTSPPPGATVWQQEANDKEGSGQERLDRLCAAVTGPEDSPYQGGTFRLAISVPDRYPFEPPQVNFVTKIYHPNIDGEGRICLDILKPLPKGVWKPSCNLHSVLTSLRVLMGEPNPSDALVAEIASECQNMPETFRTKARETTRKYAMEGGTQAARG